MRDAPPPGVCVAGMHRAGTSMVARLLNLCGLWLGPDEELVPPAPDNPAGFWENLHFVGLNEILLGALGGAWDAPPALPPRWAESPVLDEMVLAAGELVDRLAAGGRYAWKDPRNSLTVPFWRRVVPRMRIVVCLRNPLEVAASLHQRDALSLAAGFALWETYYRRLLEDTTPGERIVTHYVAYFERPATELRRLLAFVGVSPDAATIRRARAAVGAPLRHQRADLPALLAAGAPDDVIRLYADLAAEAGYAERPRPRSVSLGARPEHARHAAVG